ncbi:hypothetical protein F511_11898 [Dorcoceras hygrometricum]|uniref:Uncharacterized protein n=1 Tax=Dorcoceras hygrometricum TaxID=472368 RepID=A0A2Z7B7I9_9LAMI|nr:hypothetical protein F511_11898 [Dorcoceras hygrometricum]
MSPARRGRGKGKFHQESEGQNDEDQHSIPSRRRTRQVEHEVDELAARVDDMELVMARFQQMNPQTFNGDEPSSDVESWLQHISGLFDRVRYDDELLSKDLEYTKAYVRCDSGYDGYHETHLIVAVYSEHVPSRLGRQNEDKAARVRDYYLRCEVPCFIGREHCDVLSMQIDSDLVIYRTTLLRTFQVALSVIPRGSWGDVARRFTMIRWAAKSAATLPSPLSITPPPPPPPPCAAAAAAVFAGKLVSGQLDVENPFVLISSGLLVQPDEGVSDLVVDRIGALSVIPRGSWGDVARRFTMIRWAAATLPSPLSITPPPCAPAAAAVFAGKLVSGQLDVENPFVLISSGLLVQPDEGVSDLVVDRIGVTTAIYREEPGS